MTFTYRPAGRPPNELHDVWKIRVRRLQGEKGRALAREFNVSPSRITMLVSPKYGIWTHV